MMVPDRDFFACTDEEIAGTTSLLTIVGGKIVYAHGDLAAYQDNEPPAAMPDWSPVRIFGGYGAWGGTGSQAGAASAAPMRRTAACGCANHCTIHAHRHATAWSSRLPIADLKSFWGALGCSCWAV
jgi:hypothetical protein